MDVLSSGGFFTGAHSLGNIGYGFFLRVMVAGCSFILLGTFVDVYPLVTSFYGSLCMRLRADVVSF